VDPLGITKTLLIVLGVPVGVFVVLALLIYGPDMLRRPRYRPGRTEWTYSPVWVGGPEDPTAAVTAVPAERAMTARGGGASAGW
jgi:hypothetical protein